MGFDIKKIGLSVGNCDPANSGTVGPAVELEDTIGTKVSCALTNPHVVASEIVRMRDGMRIMDVGRLLERDVFQRGCRCCMWIVLAPGGVGGGA